MKRAVEVLGLFVVESLTFVWRTLVLTPIAGFWVLLALGVFAPVELQSAVRGLVDPQSSSMDVTKAIKAFFALNVSIGMLLALFTPVALWLQESPPAAPVTAHKQRKS